MDIQYRSVVFVDDISGEILGTGYRYGTQDAQVIDGNANPAQNYYANGVIQTYTVDQAAAKAIIPAYASHWDNTSMSWIDDRDLDTLKSDLISQITAERENVLNQPFTCPLGTFVAGQSGRMDIANAVQLSDKAVQMGQPSDVTIRLNDGTPTTFTNVQLGQLGLLFGQNWSAQYTKSDSMISAVKAATTPEDAKAAAVW